MNWKRYGKRQSWSNLRHYPDIYTEGLIKNMINLSQDRWSQAKIREWTIVFTENELSQEKSKYMNRTHELKDK
jgi:hypothetical protein